jgi:FixJ family two-component response regulator
MERYRLRNEEEAAREERCHLLGQLTTRERETLVLVVKGKTNKEIARELDISFRTVEKYRASLMGKLGVQRFAELVTLGKECLEELTAKGVA